MKRCFLLLIILFASGAAGQDRPKLIGEVEFFGYAGVDTNQLRAALPFHEQDRFSQETFVTQFDALGEAVKQAAGRSPTDMANVCCDERGNRVIFIGLAGKATRYNPPPKGRARLPERILSLFDQSIKLNEEDVQRGVSAEDDSRGYALSTYPALRAVQVEMRAYAVRHGEYIRKVLETAGDERQRIVAATLLGYARRSPSQLKALVRASEDPSGGVRNNATRALIVLARSSPKAAGEIPAGDFIEMLLSGKWTDLNKASNLLEFVTKSRNKEILRQLSRRDVLDRLIEIARWRSHGEPARYILGRIAGIDERRLEQLVAAKQVEVIVGELKKNGSACTVTMKSTERLYYDDSHLLEFEAEVLDIAPYGDGTSAVVLDRTAFYPTGGGQPSDTGAIDGLRVIECAEAEAGVVHHIIESAGPARGSTVRGRIDADRRYDHLQQHTGQHILSQAFVALYGAETRGFRMMTESSEIDIALPEQDGEPAEGRIHRAVDLANGIIWEDRPVNARQVTSDEAARLPLRKDSSREGTVRLIEIEGFDLTPCGGTHAHRTGEVGIVAVRHWERAKGLTRLDFVAGRRALADYRRANSTARAVAASFSVARDDAAAAIERLLDENRNLVRRVRALEERAVTEEASALIREADVSLGGDRVITRIFQSRGAESLKQLAREIIQHPRTVAFLGSEDGDTARIVFARSPDAAGDMNRLLREACAQLEGRGGGTAELAQGGGKAVTRLAEVLKSSAEGVASTAG